MRAIRVLCLAGSLLALPAIGWGAGFSIYEQSGRALGFSGAFTARADDASSIFFNPAGLARLEQGDVYVGTSLIYVTREFAGVNPYPGYGVKETSPDGQFFPTTVYWAQPVSRSLAVGFGFYSPFGLATEWDDPDTFSGRFISTRAAITPFYFNPTAAVELGDRVRFGGGIMAVHSSVDLDRHVAQPNPADVGPDVLDLGTVELSGSNGLDFGFNVGLQVDLTEGVTLGANYRSEVGVVYDGEADFTFQATGSPLEPDLLLLFPDDQDAETEIPFPALFVVGLGVQLSPRIAVEADLGWTQWSSFDILPLRFEDEELDTQVEEDWEDAFFLRTGAEIALNATTDLRLGYYYDETPQGTDVISPLLPDNDRHGISAGVGKRWGDWRGDLFGLLLLSKDRSTDGLSRDGYEGTYANNAMILGLSVGLNY